MSNPDGMSAFLTGIGSGTGCLKSGTKSLAYLKLRDARYLETCGKSLR